MFGTNDKLSTIYIDLHSKMIGSQHFVTIKFTRQKLISILKYWATNILKVAKSSNHIIFLQVLSMDFFHMPYLLEKVGRKQFSKNRHWIYLF